jgi:hypothetical protein
MVLPAPELFALASPKLPPSKIISGERGGRCLIKIGGQISPLDRKRYRDGSPSPLPPL